MKKILAIVLAVLFIGVAGQVSAAPANGTTLAGYKTIDICDIGDGTWKYSGVISVWNAGAVWTSGLAIEDCIQFKAHDASGPFEDFKCITITVSAQLPPYKSMAEATTFPYSFDLAAFDGYIRNSALITIMNHSGSLGTPKGPNPKATYDGPIPPPPCEGLTYGCAYTQGYWGSKPGVAWPAGYARIAGFYLSNKTWQEVLDSATKGNGYYILAQQFIAAVLNKANGASVPDGVQTTLDLASTWFTTALPSACTAASSCGLQKDWAATLDLFNNGVYPGGPAHCE